jgi:outer membrane lipoprotein-sorting protein
MINLFSGSLTPYEEKNPSFNVIEFDAEYMILLSIKTYSFDQEEANKPGGTP